MNKSSKFFSKFEKLFVRPGSIQVDLTNRCNFHCIYCYNRKFLFKDNRELLDSEWELIIKKIISLNPIVVTFSGGEPFLRFNLMHDLSRLLKQNDITVHINTNGSLINESRAKKLKQIEIDQLNINIDSLKKQDFIRGKRGLIKNLFKSFEILKKHYYPERISISCVVNKENYEEIYDIANFVKRNGFKEIHFLDMIPCDEGDKKFLLSKEEWLRFYEICNKIKKLEIQIRPNHALLFLDEFNERVKIPFCMGGRFKMVICSNAKVIPCNYFKSEKFLCGDALRDDLLKIWKKSITMREFRYFIPKEAKCQKCDMLKLCTGGCRAFASNLLRDYSKADPYCLIFDIKNAAKERFRNT